MMPTWKLNIFVNSTVKLVKETGRTAEDVVDTEFPRLSESEKDQVVAATTAKLAV